MNGRYVLDTNIVIALFDQEMAVKEKIADADEVLIPAIVIGELYHGAYRSRGAEKNVARVSSFADSHTIVPVDSTVAQFYGQIKTQLRSKGTPIPENDVWIAAVAKLLGATLAARDDHFSHVDGLAVESW